MNHKEVMQIALEALEDWDSPVALPAITALRAALAQEEQEPVATVTECEACFTPDVCRLRGTCDHYSAQKLRVAHPPRREWVSLTEEEIAEIALQSQDGISPHDDTERFARSVEQALRSKNNE